ncbi:hypothetical protein Q3G72_026791 [Acer saccharum]|nr:hypothetical protein Q3G72_026791 [Acer saccharum]
MVLPAEGLSVRNGILRNGSHSSKGSITSSDFSSSGSEPFTPATPSSRCSYEFPRTERADDAMGASGFWPMRRQTTQPKRVAWDLRQLELPQPIEDPATAYTGAQAYNRFCAPQTPGFGQPAKKVILLPNNARFVGAAYGPLATGVGKIFYANGDQYEGEVVDGYAHGYGVSTQAANNATFRGRFESGRQAQGMQTLENGYVFDGSYQNNAAHGPGYLFDNSGFVLRAAFVDGQPHGPGHARFRSGDSYIGKFSYGRLAQAPSLVRYADGRIALRIMRHGVASLHIVATHADGVFQQELLAQEHAIDQEQWMKLCEVRKRMQRLAGRADAVVFVAPQYSLLSWTPNEPQMRTLSTILGSMGEQPGDMQKAMRALLRALLHFLGPARSYATVGEIEGASEYTPCQAYPSMQAFVADTILPHYGTSKIILGAEAAGETPLYFAYRLDGEHQFAERLSQAIDDVIVGLCAAYDSDCAEHDDSLARSKMVLCSILDGTMQFDASLWRVSSTDHCCGPRAWSQLPPHADAASWRRLAAIASLGAK